MTLGKSLFLSGPQCLTSEVGIRIVPATHSYCRNFELGPSEAFHTPFLPFSGDENLPKVTQPENASTLAQSQLNQGLFLAVLSGLPFRAFLAQ